jgi:hypothetical protein
MKLIKNKKGATSESDKILFWLIFVIPSIILILVLILIAVPRLIEAQTNISPGLQQNIYMSTVIGSPLCFAYEEPITNRVYNNHIDLEKVTSEKLHDCLHLERRSELGFFMTVYKEGQFIKEIETKNVLRRVGSKSIEINRPVILIDENKKYNGVLKFTFY